MERYYPYDIFSTVRIEETLTIEDGLIQLRHTPKYRSVTIEGFNETDSISLQLNQFRVDYSLDTYYRESNRLLHFNTENNGRELTISYITCGTPITSDDMNEIKAHLDSDHSKYYQLPIATHDIRGGFRVGEGLYMTGDILNANVSSGLASLPTASANQLGGVKIGSGLSMSNDTLNATPYVLPTASTSTKGGVCIGRGLSMTGDTLNADFTGLTLGNGLAFDEDGKLCVVKEKNPDGWAYQDSGYDVIPAAPLIYVDETHFYQPEWNARMNDMFNTPEGIMEFWIRCDLTCAGLVYPNRFGFGYHSKTSDTFVGMMNGNYDNNGMHFIGYNMACFLAGENGVTGSQNRSNLYFSKNGEHHILFHAVSHPTEGYKEVTINYGTYRVSGNVNDGNPFDSFFVYSNSEHALFSNFVVSSTQIPYEDEGGD